MTATTVDFDADLLAQCEQIWALTLHHEKQEQLARTIDPLVRLWDGEMRLQHLVTSEYGVTAEINDTDSGVIEVKHPYDHPVGQWLYDEYGRLQRGEKRNVNITIDYAESRIAGLLESVELEADENGEQTVTASFLTDFERLKWYTVWANPFLPEWIQFPRAFLLAGPATWVAALTLQLQIMREQGSGWTLPSDPMDPAQRGGLNQGTWSLAVKPISFTDAMASGVLWCVVGSRFKNYVDLMKASWEDAEISPRVHCYLDGDPEPWPGANLRHGTRWVEFVDQSGRYTGTSHGGTIWDGLLRTITEFFGGFFEYSDELTGDSTIPPEYYQPGQKRTNKILPFCVWRDTDESGLTGYKSKTTPSKAVQIVTGGHSMPFVNEMISAAIQMAGDLIAMMIGVPPIGGAADAILQPLYTDTILAWMVARLPQRAQQAGWTRYFEFFQEGSGKAYTISALVVLRAGIWATRSFAASTFSVGDAAPFLIGEKGHIWLGDRGGYTIRGDRTGRIYMDRIRKLGLSWDPDTPPDWKPTFGDEKAMLDPVAKAWDQIHAIADALQQLGV